MKFNLSTCLFFTATLVLALGVPFFSPAKTLHVDVLNQTSQDQIDLPARRQTTKKDQQIEEAPSHKETKSQISRQAGDAAEGDLSPLQALLNLYQTLIFILLGVLGLVIGAAYFSLKSISQAQAEEMAAEAVSRFIGDSSKFDRNLDEAVDRKLETKIDEFRDQVSSLQEAFAAIAPATDTDVSHDLEIDESDEGEK